MKILALLLSLSILVVTHELGHLGFAKLFHTRVRRFYLFFNWKFSLFKAKKFDGKWHFLFFNAQTPASWEEENLREEDKDNTLWGIGWIPLGGYCDIAGMIDETKSADDLASEPQPWEYRSKPAWQRLCIISGGVLVNFISALVIYAGIFAHWGSDELPLRNATLGYEYHRILLDEGFRQGDIIFSIDGREMYDFAEAQQALLLDNPGEVVVRRGDSLVSIGLSGSLLERVSAEQPRQLMAVRVPFVVKDFVAGSAAKASGMQPGDSVVSVNGKPMAAFSDISAELAASAGDSIAIGFYRGGVYDSVSLLLPAEGKLGVQLVSEPGALFEVRHIDYTLLQAIPAGIKHGWGTMVTYVSSLKILFTRNGAQNLGGFGTLGSLFPTTWDWYQFWSITAFLALILAFMNVIPIPGLDGGHILFTLWEMVTRRKPSDKFLTYAQNVGMILLLMLLVIANGNDIWRAVRGMF
ncbi:MAG: regulator of sigma E protease [bacterium P3]|nr:MAG: regulator of sigma E protease [bacterium P3]KWW41048.1 MAG: regulator of sigma E protease [bacterium F083]